jgi:hypothetical protein
VRTSLEIGGGATGAVATIASSRPEAATIESRIISVHDAMASVRSMACCRAAFPPRMPGKTSTATAARIPPTSHPVAAMARSAATAAIATFGKSALERARWR